MNEQVAAALMEIAKALQQALLEHDDKDEANHMAAMVATEMAEAILTIRGKPLAGRGASVTAECPECGHKFEV